MKKFNVPEIKVINFETKTGVIFTSSNNGNIELPPIFEEDE